MFTRCVLPAVKERADLSQARAVKDRLARWRGGDYLALWKEAVDMTRSKVRGRKKNSRHTEMSLEERNAERSKRLIQQGEYS